MRYIQINDELQNSTYDTIVRFDCGPDFVYKRLPFFKMMIKEQGVAFWFRLWLTFCFNPGCSELKAVQDQWPYLATYTKICVHEQIFQGSIEDAIKYILDKAIKSLEDPDNLSKSKLIFSVKIASAKYGESFLITELKPKELEMQVSKSSRNNVHTPVKKHQSSPNARISHDITPETVKLPSKTGLRLNTLQLKSSSEDVKVNKCRSSTKDNFLLPCNKNSNCAQTCNSSKKSKEQKLTKSYQSRENFRALLQECTEMAFGAAVCVIFYKWLIATEINGRVENYWKLPKEYLSLKFKPGPLEGYLVKYWDTKVHFLLGVGKKQIPWLANLMSSKLKPSVENIVDKSMFPTLTEQTVLSLNQHKEEKRQQLYKLVELKKESEEMLSKMSSTHLLKHPNSCVKIENKCFYCNNSCNNIDKKCLQCVTERWSVPRQYCSDLCRIEHWFTEHSKEHYMRIATSY